MYGYLLLILLSGIGIGILSALWGKMLDDYMDFGGILWPVRKMFMVRSMNRQGIDPGDTFAEIQSNSDDFEDAERLHRELSWTLAIKDFWLIGWICRSCITQRINILITTMGIGAFLLYGAVELKLIAIYALSVPVSHWLSEKL